MDGLDIARTAVPHEEKGRLERPGARATTEGAMPAYVIFDVEIRDPAHYQEFMAGLKPALEAAGARHLPQGGAHKVYEGDWESRSKVDDADWEPRRIVLLEFPSVEP